MKNHALTCISVIVLTVLLTVSFAAAVSPACFAHAEANSSFSIVWITDTQYLSESYPTYFNNLCQWIVNNKDAYNVQMVIHTGDIINDDANLTEWANANESMSILLNNDVPYCWDAGNHDYDSSCWVGNQFTAFNPQAMQSKPYWVSDDFEGMNTAVHFDVNGWDCLIINIAYHANDSVLAWANNLLNAYPQSHAIVATHAFINQQCNYDSWALNFKKTVLDTHSNVFLTLNGHYHPAAGNRTEVGGRYELLYNQQDSKNETGADSARILTFNTDKGTIDAQTYNQLTNQFLQDPTDNFTLTTNFRNSSAVGNVPEFPASTFLVILVSASTFSIVVISKKTKMKIWLEAATRRQQSFSGLFGFFIFWVFAMVGRSIKPI